MSGRIGLRCLSSRPISANTSNGIAAIAMSPMRCVCTTTSIVGGIWYSSMVRLGSADTRICRAEFSPAAGSEFSVIRTDNATGNFTKVAQRVPVRIAIDPKELAEHPLRGRLFPELGPVTPLRTLRAMRLAIGARHAA